MDDRETEHEDLVVIYLIQWGNERLRCIYSESCMYSDSCIDYSSDYVYCCTDVSFYFPCLSIFCCLSI